ncbi:MAG: arginyl-tRNA--protein arginylyltransferase, partial [Saprospiraceae bacterium]
MQRIKMTTEREYPVFIVPEELDDYLSHGWYRMGQAIFTCHFLWFGEKLYSAIWLRLPLLTFQFSKGQRKLLRRNAQRFT